jgi:glycosyltransferase involved in cell wall biosynthesis
LLETRRADTVLFYGSMIPLHGIETIIKAASLFRNDEFIRFKLVGMGQEYRKARELSSQLGTDNVIEWIDTVPYTALSKLIADSTICLGVFGTSDKASAVVPNKVFQCLSVGRPVISGDTDAMREWFTDGKNCLLVPPGDSTALAAAIRRLKGNAPLQSSLASAGHELFNEKFSSVRIGQLLSEVLTRIA